MSLGVMIDWIMRIRVRDINPKGDVVRVFLVVLGLVEAIGFG